MKTSDDIVAEIVERADSERQRLDRINRLWDLGGTAITVIGLIVLLGLGAVALAQSGQHGREYRDGCGNRYVDMVENDSIESRVPLPPRVCKKVDKGLPTERLVIIEWKQDGYREIP